MLFETINIIFGIYWTLCHGKDFLKKHIFGMVLAEQPLKLRNPCLVLIPLAIAAERFFGILSQFISPSRW